MSVRIVLTAPPSAGGGVGSHRILRWKDADAVFLRDDVYEVTRHGEVVAMVSRDKVLLAEIGESSVETWLDVKR